MTDRMTRGVKCDDVLKRNNLCDSAKSASEPASAIVSAMLGRYRSDALR
ncbi:MAG: hypothetical protein AABP62_26260 [Planctomycetota bacterium]